MATTLYFVQNDTRPQIKLTLTDQNTGTPFNLSSSTLQVNLHVKPVVGTGVSFTSQATKLNQTTNPGEAVITWVPGDLNRPAGEYNAEVELFDSNNGYRETVYDFIKIVIREDIGDVPNIVLPPSPPAPPPNTNP